MNSKNVLLIGSGGLIGSNILSHLKDNEYNVIDVDFPKIDVRSITSISDFTTNLNSLKIDCVILGFGLNDHVKKNTSRNIIENIVTDDIQRYLDVNLLGVFNVVQAFIKLNPKIKFIHLNSMYSKSIPHPKNYNGDHKDIGYVVSKSAANALIKYFSAHYPKATFIDLIIGAVENNQPDFFRENFRNDIVRENLLDSITICNHILFYIESEYVTGIEVDISGGKFIY